MAALIKKHSSKIGKMPGSVVFVGDQKGKKGGK